MTGVSATMSPHAARGWSEPALPALPPTESAASFRRALDQAASDVDELRDAATRLVSTALVQPLLESLRESPFAEGPFAPGAAERRFGPLLDTAISDRITASSRFALVDAIVARLSPGPVAAREPSP